jgi:signal transduction histidine kinase
MPSDMRSRPGSRPARLKSALGISGDVLSIQIRDDGPGLDENFREGIGLANTRARLERLYGEAHRFELKNAAAGGLVVRVEIPFVTEDAHATVQV